MSAQPIPDSPRILTTTVGSYPVPDWLAVSPSEQAVMDATRVIFDTQRQAGIDLPTDGELYRFDVNHPDTNGMIEYFTGKLTGATSAVGRSGRWFRQAWTGGGPGVPDGRPRRKRVI